MKRVLLIVIGIVAIAGWLSRADAQQFAKVGTAGAQFLKIGAGARFTGMGGACVAVTNDASAVFWNPSGITGVKNMSIFTSHIEWFADIKYEAITIAKTFPTLGTFALSGTYLTSGDIEITTFEQQDGTGETYSKNDMMIGLSFARFLTDKFTFGGTVKYVREDYGTVNSITGDDEVAGTMAFDIGSIYSTGFKSLRLGISIFNFGPELSIPGQYEDITNFDSDAQEYVREPAADYRPYHMPLQFRAGLAMEVYETELNTLTLAADLVHPNDNVEQVNLGGEYWFKNMFALRGGYIGNHDAARFSFGGSLKFNVNQMGAASLDYSYTDFGILEMVHQMSLVLNF